MSEPLKEFPDLNFLPANFDLEVTFIAIPDRSRSGEDEVWLTAPGWRPTLLDETQVPEDGWDFGCQEGLLAASARIMGVGVPSSDGQTCRADFAWWFEWRYPRGSGDEPWRRPTLAQLETAGWLE